MKKRKKKKHHLKMMERNQFLNSTQVNSNGPKLTENQRICHNSSKEWKVSILFMKPRKLKTSVQTLPSRPPTVLTNSVEDFKILIIQTNTFTNRSSSSTERNLGKIKNFDHFIKNSYTNFTHKKP